MINFSILFGTQMRPNCREISVNIEMGYGLDGRNSIPSRGKKFSLLHRVQIGLGPTQPPI
jgi:hypothetical protein